MRVGAGVGLTGERARRRDQPMVLPREKTHREVRALAAAHRPLAVVAATVAQVVA